MRIEGDVRRSTSPICMSLPKTTQGIRRKVLDGINRIDRIKKGAGE